MNNLLYCMHQHNRISSATIARYIETELTGIDITVFTIHSTRISSTIRANNAGLSIKDIQKAAWLSSTLTFTKYCKMPIQKNFGSVILEGHSHQ